MGILGIHNRTENWKTVQHFHGLSDAAKVRLVRRLGEPDDTVAEEIGLELFWCGARDFVFPRKDTKEEIEVDRLVHEYRRYFVDLLDLREKIMNFKHAPSGGFSELKDDNYNPSADRLARNVQNTEVDIVLETPDRIFIGEAKYESPLGGDGKLVLVHQLIRQYVTAKILVHLTGRPKSIVPFVVTESGEKFESMKNTAQVAFMIEQGWLRKDNVLTWATINDIRIGCG